MERFNNFEERINLDDFEEYDDIEGEYKEFEIKDASTADWAISKIADERKRRDYFVACAEEEIANLKTQIEEIKAKCERTTSYLSGCLGKYLEQDDVPKKKTTTQESVTLPAGKIVKKLPKTKFIMYNGKEITDNKSNDKFVNEIKELNSNYIKSKEEVDWNTLKKNITFDDEGNVITKDTGEFIESLRTTSTFTSIEIETPKH